MEQAAIWRDDFPALTQEVNNRPLVYLDSAASAQKPLSVIESISQFYRHEYAAVHRGIHTLSAQATEHMELVRDKVCTFINASQREEIIFVNGTTHGINLIANTFGKQHLVQGDEIIISEMEHHANIVPWQMLEHTLGIKVVVWQIENDGSLCLDKLRALITSRTRLLAIAHVSNVLGTVNPIQAITSLAHQFGVKVLVDGAQAIMHQHVDVQALNCDFYVFSGHKLYGPTGIGVLYGKKALLDTLPPWEGGGSMIQNVDLEHGTTYNRVPWRFEAGSPNVAGIIGLGQAIDYLLNIGFEQIHQYETMLVNYLYKQLQSIPSVDIYGPEVRAGVVAFNLGELHAFDVGSFLDKYGVAIRTGHHCAQPLMKHYGVTSMCRASIAIYNTQQDIDTLVTSLKRIQTLLG
ncbi:cysteine desulfurase SufS [Vibrio caribbeanicus]|uniref:cysteine desulfurase SufS n=1 Tax=Vibrio caribbeanicus TaxID=701175 RepID=UPI002283ECB4|nr:cysteine desulfurase SufS [Vibrio caribbeanicus]MCY9845185.1 cysteine desulfurase SufS [Vibrio caribbeanicus]